jgi:hypothetical protein
VSAFNEMTPRPASSYNGYLKPWFAKMVAWHSDGLNAREIARRLITDCGVKTWNMEYGARNGRSYLLEQEIDALSGTVRNALMRPDKQNSLARIQKIEPRPEAAARPDDMSLDRLELTVRVINCAKNNNLRTVGDVRAVSDTDLLRLPNFGRRSLQEAYEEGLRPIRVKPATCAPPFTGCADRNDTIKRWTELAGRFQALADRPVHAVPDPSYGPLRDASGGYASCPSVPSRSTEHDEGYRLMAEMCRLMAATVAVL